MKWFSNLPKIAIIFGAEAEFFIVFKDGEIFLSKILGFMEIVEFNEALWQPLRDVEQKLCKQGALKQFLKEDEMHCINKREIDSRQPSSSESILQDKVINADDPDYEPPPRKGIKRSQADDTFTCHEKYFSRFEVLLSYFTVSGV